MHYRMQRQKMGAQFKRADFSTWMRLVLDDPN